MLGQREERDSMFSAALAQRGWQSWRALRRPGACFEITNLKMEDLKLEMATCWCVERATKSGLSDGKSRTGRTYTHIDDGRKRCEWRFPQCSCASRRRAADAPASVADGESSLGFRTPCQPAHAALRLRHARVVAKGADLRYSADDPGHADISTSQIIRMWRWTG
jgi:hypothetical protein